jgi:hypothetical protein
MKGREIMDLYEYQKKLLLEDLITEYKLPRLGSGKESKKKPRRKIRSFILNNIIENNMFKLSKELNPESKKFSIYLYLDRNFANSATDDDTYIKWNIGYNTVSSIDNRGVNILSEPVKIHAIRLGRTSFMEMHESQLSDIFNLKYFLCVEIKEFREQSIIGQNGIRFNHCLKLFVIDNTGEIVYTPFYDIRGWYRFAEPKYLPDSITMGFWDYIGDSIISMKRKTVSHVLSGDKSGTGLRFVTAKIFPDYSGFTGSITVSGFTTADPVGDAAIIALVNSTHILTYVEETFFFLGHYRLTLSGLSSIPNGIYPNITLTYNYKFNVSTHMQLICEMDEDSKIL